MTSTKTGSGKPFVLDDADKQILRILQADATLPLEAVATKIGLSKTAVWNRLQRMRQEGLILKTTLLLDAEKAGVPETFFVAIKTSKHNDTWLNQLQKIVLEIPEITEAHRLSGDIDYLLKVQVKSTKDFDRFYKHLVSEIELYNVTSNLSMEVLKEENTLPF